MRRLPTLSSISSGSLPLLLPQLEDLADALGLVADALDVLRDTVFDVSPNCLLALPTDLATDFSQSQARRRSRGTGRRAPCLPARAALERQPARPLRPQRRRRRWPECLGLAELRCLTVSTTPLASADRSCRRAGRAALWSRPAFASGPAARLASRARPLWTLRAPLATWTSRPLPLRLRADFELLGSWPAVRSTWSRRALGSRALVRRAGLLLLRLPALLRLPWLAIAPTSLLDLSRTSTTRVLAPSTHSAYAVHLVWHGCRPGYTRAVGDAASRR